jgi:hypothetical protein
MSPLVNITKMYYLNSESPVRNKEELITIITIIIYLS